MFLEATVFKFFITFFLSTTSFYLYAVSCAPLPHYILETNILSCELIRTEKNHQSKSVLLEVKVTDEIRFSPVRPINWEDLSKQEPVADLEPLKNTIIKVITDPGQYNCVDARYNAEEVYGQVFVVRQLCCLPGASPCELTNYRASLLPYKQQYYKDKSWQYDQQFNFDLKDAIKKHNKRIKK